jgi:hypothetical protein
VGALAFHFFDPLGISLAKGILHELLVGCFPLTVFKTMALGMPFVAHYDCEKQY